jgi:hypothetical protein
MLPIKYTQLFTATWDVTWSFAYFVSIRIVLMVWWLIERNVPETCRKAEVLEYFCSIGRRGWGSLTFLKLSRWRLTPPSVYWCTPTTIHVSASFSVVIQQRTHLVDPCSLSYSDYKRQKWFLCFFRLNYHVFIFVELIEFLSLTDVVFNFFFETEANLIH